MQEIQYSLTLRVSNQGYNYQFSEAAQPSQNALGGCGEVVSVATTAQTLPVTGITTLGYANFKNLDPTNYLTIGSLVTGTYFPFVRLKAGESAVLRLQPGLTIQAQANTAACMLAYYIQND